MKIVVPALTALIAAAGLVTFAHAADAPDRYGTLTLKVVVSGKIVNTVQGVSRRETTVNRTFLGSARMKFSGMSMAPGDVTDRTGWDVKDVSPPAPSHLDEKLPGGAAPTGGPGGMNDLIMKCAQPQGETIQACMAREAAKRCTDQKNDKMCNLAVNMGQAKTKFDVTGGSRRDPGSPPKQPGPARNMEYWKVVSCQETHTIGDQGVFTMYGDPAVGGLRNDTFSVRGDSKGAVKQGGACNVAVRIDRRNMVGDISWRVQDVPLVETVVQSPLPSANTRWSKPTNIFADALGYKDASFKVEKAGGVSPNGFSGSKTFASTPGDAFQGNTVVTWSFNAE